MKITAAVTHEKDTEFQIENVELDDQPKVGEVLVQLVATGICHTDISASKQNLGNPLPAVLGHEGAGIIKQVGEGVKNVQVGDHVVMSYSSCGRCENCLTGHLYACERMAELNFEGAMEDGTYRLHQNGQHLAHFFGQSSFGTYAIVNERNLVKVDKDVDLRLLAPLGCGIQTGAGAVLNTFQVPAGSSIVIFGSGTVGMSALMAAKVAGCTTRIIVDIHNNRLELGKELGATHVINSKEVNAIEEIKNITKTGVDFAIETTGVPAVLRQAVESVTFMGKVGIIGAPKANTDVHLDVNDMIMSAKSVSGILQGSSIPQVFIPKLIELYKQGQFPFDKLFNFYSFNEINQAVSDSGSGKTLKPILTF
ncbi:MAG: NAD(P)-dependent alcohol dehydrogenase [Bacillus sp. (in: firmicutes)]